MNKTVKTVIGYAAAVATAFGIFELNRRHKEKHGKSYISEAKDYIEQHQVVSSAVLMALAVMGSSTALAYRDSHRPEEWYELEKKRAEERTKQHEMELAYKERMFDKEEKAKEEEQKRLAVIAEKEYQRELEYNRQMPEGYWTFKAAEERRKAEEARAKISADATTHMYDTAYKTARYISDNRLEEKRAKYANKSEEEDD